MYTKSVNRCLTLYLLRFIETLVNYFKLQSLLWLSSLKCADCCQITHLRTKLQWTVLKVFWQIQIYIFHTKTKFAVPLTDHSPKKQITMCFILFRSLWILHQFTYHFAKLSNLHYDLSPHIHNHKISVKICGCESRNIYYAKNQLHFRNNRSGKLLQKKTKSHKQFRIMRFLNKLWETLSTWNTLCHTLWATFALQVRCKCV